MGMTPSPCFFMFFPAFLELCSVFSRYFLKIFVLGVFHILYGFAMFLLIFCLTILGLLGIVVHLF